MAEFGFCEGIPLQPLHWDASRLRVAQQCWRKHLYSTGWGLRSNFKSPHTEFGKLYHAVVERFDLSILKGEPREDAIDSALDFLLSETWDTETGQPWGGSLEECFQCTSPAMRPHKRDPSKLVPNRERCQFAKAPSPLMPVYPSDFIGDRSPDTPGEGWACEICHSRAIRSFRYLPFHPKKHRVNLVRAFLAYADAPESVLPYQFPGGRAAVELECRLRLPAKSPDGIPYELVANIDSLVTWEGELAVRERKTTGSRLDLRYWQTFDLDPQIDTYELVAWALYADEMGGVPPRVLVEAMRIDTASVELVRMPIAIPEERRAEWFNELQDIIDEAESRAILVKNDVCSPEEAFPRNSSACIGPYGPCQFLRVCRAGQTDRAAILAEYFHEERWVPISTESES